MTRDSRFFILVNKDCKQIIHDVVQHPNYQSLKYDIAIFEIWKKPEHGYGIISVSDEIDKIVRDNGGEEKYDLIIEQLKKKTNEYPLVFGEESLASYLPYIIPHSPRPAYVTGKKGKDYIFEAFNIDDKIREDASGVYIFTITKEDKRATPIESHLFISFDSIQHNNKEAILKAKEKGARHIFYYHSAAEYERQEIIEDIKAGQDYQYQLANFPEVSETP